MTEEQATTTLDFLSGGGSTGQLIRSFDWQQTHLGAAETWPQSLRTAVSLMLGGAQPVYIAWGPKLVSLYNDAYLPIVGTKHSGIGLPFRELWAEIWDEFRPFIEKTLAGDAQHFVDMPIALAGRPGVPVGYFTFSYTALRDDAGKIAGFYCAATETTDQVLAEHRLRESEERFRTLADHAPVMMWVTNADGFCTYLNRGWYAFTGQTNEQAEGFGWLDATHPDDKAEAERVFLEANTARVPFRLEYRLRRADGSYRWAIDAAQPRFSESSEYLGYVGSVIDIDDSKRADTALSAAQRSLTFLLELSETLRPLKTTDEICHAASRLLGTEIKADRVFYAEDQRDDETIVVTKSYIDGVAGIEGRYRYVDYGATLLEELRSGQTYRIDDIAADVSLTPQTKAAQAQLQVAATLNVPLVKDGHLDGVLGVHFRQPHAFSEAEIALTQAVAERTWAALTRSRAEAALRASEERLRLAIENAEIGFWDVNVVDDVLVWSERTKAMFGIFSDIPTTMRDFYEGLHPEDREEISAAYAAATDPVIRPLYDVEYRTVGKDDGVVRWVAAKGRGVFDDAGRCLRVAGTTIDITARKNAEAALEASQSDLKALNETLENRVHEAIAAREQMQETLKQSQKLESMGQLTGGVAHDFNNLLTPILGSLDMLHRRELGNDREKRLIEGALHSAERAKVLVQRLLSFARRQPLQQVAVNLKTLVEGMIDLVESTCGPRINVLVDVRADLPMVNADPHQLEMAILNISVNARDAMSDGGTITITCMSAIPDEAGVSDPFVRLAIKDTGTGMDAETLARAIEPFFSTKGVGQGTGLGLSMAHGLAAQLGGHLSVESESGQGTTVTFHLPIASHAEARVERTDPKVNHSLTGIALLIDDEQMVRDSTANMLFELGYEVVEAGSAEEALERLDAGLRPSIILSDHLMQGMSGTEFARLVSARGGMGPVLLVSGYSEEAGIDPTLPRLIKPFKQFELAAALVALTGSP